MISQKQLTLPVVRARRWGVPPGCARLAPQLVHKGERLPERVLELFVHGVHGHLAGGDGGVRFRLKRQHQRCDGDGAGARAVQGVESGEDGTALGVAQACMPGHVSVGV